MGCPVNFDIHWYSIPGVEHVEDFTNLHFWLSIDGFFSKELLYDGALERGWIFYAMAVIGSFFTAASFLKLGHAAFLGPDRKSTRLNSSHDV
jgi:NADH:ubiquinone oxidoreductase subunit 5 (subunit L)/multisubunit Na+/H+ antiporter MnhA subunit